MGMLRWQEEGQSALITDPNEPFWVTTPLSPPEKTVVKGSARLKLSEDGTLEGDVRVEYTGHLAAYYKYDNIEDSQAEREQKLQDKAKSLMSTAEVTDIRIENINDPVKPFIYQYHVRVPGYAQRTGKRLFLQPAFFQSGTKPVFQTSKRKYPIYFTYPWSEEDEVTIELPAGFALDSPDAPAPFSSDTLSKYDVQIQAAQDGKSLVYKRRFFFFGGGGMDRILYASEVYPRLKGYFDKLHQHDSHTITLKQGASASAAVTGQ